MSKTSAPRSTKFARVKERLFADVPAFDTSKGLFVPLPMILRVALRKFSPREWQVLSWIYMHCGKEGLCSFTLDQLMHGIDYKSKSKLRTLLDELQRRLWIERRVEAGTDYYVARDPMEALRRNVEEGYLSPEIFAEVNELLAQMKRETVEVPTPRPKSSNSKRGVR
jgi:hypothetical protein